jgi:hypothetical protein
MIRRRDACLETRGLSASGLPDLLVDLEAEKSDQQLLTFLAAAMEELRKCALREHDGLAELVEVQAQ